MTDLRFDWERQSRTGVPEVVFAQGKTVAQIASVIAQARHRDQNLLLTRLAPEQFEQLRGDIDVGGALDYDEISQTAILGAPVLPATGQSVGVVCAGTSDLPVAREALRSLSFLGVANELYADVGVAGLWRLMAVERQLKSHDVVIAVAGMEGALFSVVAGLVPGIVIAVPTSVGYGVASGGQAALSSALASCAPGVVTVNIDNGFGAAAAARKILVPANNQPGQSS